MSCGGTSSNLGAELQQSSIFHTQRAWLNGRLLPMMDPVNPKLDISPWLQEGLENVLMIEVATTLLNAINVFPDNQIESVGYTRARKLAEGKVKRGHQKYGLTGSVEIVPFGRVQIRI